MGLRILLLTASLTLSSVALAAPPDDAQRHPLELVKKKGLEERLDAFSKLFLGRPYAFDSALGEGPKGHFDTNPLVRFDTFHCVTYLETVVALALSDTVPAFERTLRKIRYKDGKVGFETRNHFPCIDWVPNNLKAGFFEDITEVVAGAPTRVRVAKAKIDRKAWYGAMNEERLVLPEADEATRAARLEELHHRAEKTKPQVGTLRYIPLFELFPQPEPTAEKPFDATLPEDKELFHRIPSGTVVSIVRPNWNVLKVIGTRMNVSHQGFLFWIDDVLYLRHAKKEVGKKVSQEPFVDYLRRASAFPSVGGIHLLGVRDPGAKKGSDLGRRPRSR